MSNKGVVSLESVVKSDLCVEQRVYFVRGLQKRSQASIKGRGSIGLKKGSVVYFVQEEDCLRLVGKESYNDHGFISN